MCVVGLFDPPSDRCFRPVFILFCLKKMWQVDETVEHIPTKSNRFCCRVKCLTTVIVPLFLCRKIFASSRHQDDKERGDVNEKLPYDKVKSINLFCP